MYLDRVYLKSNEMESVFGGATLRTLFQDMAEGIFEIIGPKLYKNQYNSHIL